MRAVLLVLFLIPLWFMAMHSGCISAQTNASSADNRQVLLVKIITHDLENAYNSAFHKINLQLAETEGISEVVFAEEFYLFALKADANVSADALSKKLGQEVIIETADPAAYRHFWNAQFAAKLADRKGNGAPADPTFPRFTPGTDSQTYRREVAQWLSLRPDFKYRPAASSVTVPITK